MADSQGKAWGHTSSTAKPSSSQVKEGVHTASVPALLSPPPDFLFTNNLRFVTVTRFHVGPGHTGAGPGRGDRLTCIFESMLLPLVFLKPTYLCPKIPRPPLPGEDAVRLGLTRIRKGSTVAQTILALDSQGKGRGQEGQEGLCLQDRMPVLSPREHFSFS